MKLAAVHIAAPQVAIRPTAGGVRAPLSGSTVAGFGETVERVEAAQRAQRLNRFDLRSDEQRAEEERQDASAAADSVERGDGPAVEILLPKDAFVSAVVPEVRIADMAGQPSSLERPEPGTPAAAYVRAAELLATGGERGTLLNAVI